MKDLHMQCLRESSSSETCHKPGTYALGISSFQPSVSAKVLHVM